MRGHSPSPPHTQLWEAIHQHLHAHSCGRQFTITSTHRAVRDYSSPVIGSLYLQPVTVSLYPQPVTDHFTQSLSLYQPCTGSFPSQEQFTHFSTVLCKERKKRGKKSGRETVVAIAELWIQVVLFLLLKIQKVVQFLTSHISFSTSTSWCWQCLIAIQCRFVVDLYCLCQCFEHELHMCAWTWTWVTHIQMWCRQIPWT